MCCPKPKSLMRYSHGSESRKQVFERLKRGFRRFKDKYYFSQKEEELGNQTKPLSRKIKPKSTSINFASSTRFGKFAPSTQERMWTLPRQMELEMFFSRSCVCALPHDLSCQKLFQGKIFLFSPSFYRSSSIFWEDTVTLWAPVTFALETQKYCHALMIKQWSSGYVMNAITN